MSDVYHPYDLINRGRDTGSDDLVREGFRILYERALGRRPVVPPEQHTRDLAELAALAGIKHDPSRETRWLCRGGR